MICYFLKEALLLLEVNYFTNLTQYKMQNNNACLTTEIASVVDQVLHSPGKTSSFLKSMAKFPLDSVREYLMLPETLKHPESKLQ